MRFDEPKDINRELSDVAIKVTNLSKRFKNYEEKESTLKSTVINLIKKRKITKKEFWSLRDINFEIKRGETFGIIGSNGSGKSTLLKILAGIIYPTEGSVKVNGRISTLFELGTGFHPELSGRDNIFLNGTILGLTNKEVREKYDSIVEFSELKDFIDMPLKHYSSGMQMRLAFAVAISVRPDILVVDEVLAVGDAEFQAKSYNAFREFKKHGTTVVFVSHDLEAIKGNCDRVVLIDKSRQVALGKPVEIISKYQAIVEGREQDSFVAKNNNLGRFGDQTAQVDDVWIEDGKGDRVNVIADKTITLKMLCNFHTEANNPIFGLTIRDVQGRQILATNTLWNNIETGSYKSGDKVVITIKVPNVLEKGEYTLSPAITHEGAKQFYDHRDDLVTFVAQKEYLTNSIVNPPSEIIIESPETN